MTPQGERGQWVMVELCKDCDEQLFGETELETLTYGGHRRPNCARCGHVFEGIEQSYMRRK